MAFTYGWMNDDIGNGMLLGGGILRGGWFKNASSSTGGDIINGFSQTMGFLIQQHKATAVTSQAVVNEVVSDVSQPMTGTITIVTEADAVGRWYGIGN